MKIIAGVLGVFLVLSCFAAAEELSWEDISSGNVDFRAILFDSGNPKIILAATKGVVLKSEDEALSYRRVLSIGGDNRVNLLVQNDKIKNVFYCLTTNGLYLSNNRGNDWRRIFKGRNYLENECTSIVVLPDFICLGTRSGLFLSRDGGRNWQKETGILGKCDIYSLDADLSKAGCIYSACAQGVFRRIYPDGKWERIFVTYLNNETANDREEKPQDYPEEEEGRHVNYVGVDYGSAATVYLATSSGVFKSKDSGTNWEHISDYGLLSGDVKRIIISKQSAIYAITRSGIFIYGNERWQELSLGLTGGEIRTLALDSSNNLYAVCEKGLFKSKTDTPAKNFKEHTTSYFQKEPSIKEIQQAAINYAEVAPEKIAQWRKKAAVKAMLPQVSAGVDRNTTDLWHWESGSSTKNDDDILRRGDDSIDWDVRLTWDLGELIWNEDQTSIDVRSKLMVQLRGDILDEVNKLYFERIRVKMELDNVTVGDKKKALERELRLQELTASLDGLTGGYFSQHLK
ncbi:MAG: hypothetical protein WC417_01880 [Candidatus Omnitrophota bacterium]|jgi:photosystem II stability/assembly factor-like uncharacterized protein